eukprot:TRINITY_DN12898_c0_g1_i1.p1 TRINITY_DN12898_c0_g1~~TRINITY_DN12898_c0_g1_i1.p1  ORF type:complete len:224 (+),score=20.99 TRINITY_DN12898_c0_g1_i1:51-722(+)
MSRVPQDHDTSRIMTPAASSLSLTPGSQLPILQNLEQVQAVIDASIAGSQNARKMLEIWETALENARLSFESKSSWEANTRSSNTTLQELHRTLVYRQKEDDYRYPAFKKYEFTLGPLPGHPMLRFHYEFDENGEGFLLCESDTLLDGSYIAMFRAETSSDNSQRQATVGALKQRWRRVASKLGVPSSIPLSEFVNMIRSVCDHDECFESHWSRLAEISSEIS